MELARGVAKSFEGQIWHPLEVINYNQELRRSMEYVFGNTLICSNQKIAKSICFDSNLKIRCVTIDGDVYNPSGALEGGFKQSGDCLL